MIQPISQPSITNVKKVGFFKKNRNKITRGVNIAVNLAGIIGIGVCAVLHIIAPALAVVSLPAIFSLIVQWASKNAPETLEDIKKLFISKASTETDRDSVSRTYEEILSTLSQTERTIQPESEPYIENIPALYTINENIREPVFDESPSEPTQRLPVHIVWNTKTNKAEYTTD